MARPPSGYKPEPGVKKGRCGESWSRTIVATGEIPNADGFGADRKVVLPPITTFQSFPPEFGRKDLRESAIARAVEETVAQTQDRLDLESGWFTVAEYESIRWLLVHAVSELAAAQEIYRRYDLRPGGPFPLELGDRLVSFPSAADIRDCTDPDNIKDPPGSPDYGADVPGRGRSIARCPTRLELRQRPKARDAIRQHMVDALYNARCAQWGMWRTLLYKQALEDYVPTFEPGVAQPTEPGVQPTPGVGVDGGLQQRPKWQEPPPPFPPDAPPVDVDKLGPPEKTSPPPDDGFDDVGTTAPRPKASTSRKANVGKAVGLLAGAAILLTVGPKVLS